MVARGDFQSRKGSSESWNILVQEGNSEIRLFLRRSAKP